MCGHVGVLMTGFLLTCSLVDSSWSAAMEAHGSGETTTTRGLSSIILANRPARRSGSNSPVQLCGLRLLEAVRGLCGGKYAGYSRRSDPSMSSRVSMYGIPSMILREPSTNTIESREPDDLIESPGELGWSAGASEPDDMDMMTSWPHKSNNNKGPSFHVLRGKSRFRRSIIEECCERPCTVRQMLKYCGPRN